MDRFENTLIKIYNDEAKNNTQKALAGYKLSNDFDEIPDEIKKLSLGLWNPLLKAVIPAKTGNYMLDIGCGSGFDIYYLSKRFKGAKIFGVDLTFKLLKKGKKVFKNQNIPLNIVNANITSLPFKDNSFDFALSHAVIHLIREKHKSFMEIYRILKDNGLLIVCDPVISGKMPEFLIDEYNNSDGIFIYGALKDIDFYKNTAQNCGFSYFDLIEYEMFYPQKEIINLLKKRYHQLPVKLEKEILKLKFYITVIGLSKKNKFGYRKTMCDNCNKEIIIPYNSFVNTLKDPELKEDIIKNRLNIYTCPDCNQIIDTPEPFLFINTNGRIYNKIPKKYKDSKINASSYFKKLGENIMEVYDIDGFKRLITKKWWQFWK